jgi:TetR/AcrR family transcriptional repressor of nem operon
MPKPNLKEAFMAAGHDEFHVNGYHGTGVAAIAQRAGGPKGSFYNHFASKEELAVAVIARYSDSRRMDMLDDTSVSPLARIRAHFLFLQADLAKDSYERGCMFGNFAAETASTNDNLRKVVDNALDYWCEHLAAALEDARALGEIAASTDTHSTAQLLVDAWEGGAIRAKAVGDASPIENFMTLVFGRMLAP